MKDLATRVRPLRWPADQGAITGLDRSFTTARVLRVRRRGLSITLETATIAPALTKTYPLRAPDLERFPRLAHVVVAEQGEAVVGVVAAGLSAWNRRVEIEHLYVDVSARGRGFGRALVESVLRFAAEIDARCVWVETQNVNLPAVRFYRGIGFELAGLDESLYDPEPLSGEEVALFFARPVGP